MNKRNLLDAIFGLIALGSWQFVDWRGRLSVWEGRTFWFSLIYSLLDYYLEYRFFKGYRSQFFVFLVN